MKNVLIVSGDMVNSNMGGVGIRYWELAHALAKNVQVTLAVPNITDLRSSSVKLVEYDLREGDLRAHAQGMDVLVVHGFILHFHPYLNTLSIPVAVDLYVPFLLESLVWHDQDNWDEWLPAYDEYLRVQLELIRAGDFFFCASERQRDYWLGWLHAEKRINQHTYHADPSLRSLIDVVPFGVPADPPKLDKPAMRGVKKGVALDDQIILWSGGLWDWLDPLTLIQAVATLVPKYPKLKLFFMGTHHPNPVVSGMSMPERAIALSRDLGLLDKHIFFGNWVAYEDRVNYLMEADLAVVSHPGHIETHFSFRTRVLDCIWTGLPIVTTEGDAIANWVEEYQLGFTVTPGDVKELAQAVENILSSGSKKVFAPAFEKLRKQLQWGVVVKPLAAFCLKPSLSPDKGKYQTELERLRKDKDEFIAQVINDKDAHLGQVIRDKDAHLADVIAEKDAMIAHYRNMLPLRIYRKLKSLLRLS